MTLTRAQLAALTDLHRYGEVVNLSRMHARTLERLIGAGVARWERDADGCLTRRVVPTVPTWADGFGAWHVSLPSGLDNPAAVARAVIRGEVWARETTSAGPPRWRLDVERAPMQGRPDVTEWREAFR